MPDPRGLFGYEGEGFMRAPGEAEVPARRSDERIGSQIRQWLAEDHQLDGNQIEVRVLDGEVTLSGSVSSRWAKKRVEEHADRALGIRDVHNRLVILEHIGKASE